MSDARKSILVFGATGTAGRAAALALDHAGHSVRAVVREGSAAISLPRQIETLTAKDAFSEKVDVIVSCVASRTGAPKDAWAVDYQFHSDLLKQAMHYDVRQFIYLSAICVQRPHLEFQKAKLAFEAELRNAPLTHTIVHPTAFFKSLSGQVDRVKNGKPFLVFGDGRQTACTPISDRDLGSFIASCITDPAHANATLPIGGPGPALTPLDMAAMLGRLTGQDVKTKHIPLGLVRGIVRIMGWLAPLGEKWAARAEFARIAQYYATQSMLSLDPETGTYSRDMTPSFGTDRLEDHYRALLDGTAETDLGTQAIFDRSASARP